VRRHRLFESSVALLAPGPCRHAEQGRPVGVYGSKADDIPQGGRTARTLQEGRDAMGIGWMSWAALVEAIPPAYTEHIGAQLIGALR
jgi:DNA (cytosine-5)-methyltransferase 1